jgi:D-alanine-D-alanine ligase
MVLRPVNSEILNSVQRSRLPAVVVVFGGWSPEREVSLESGHVVAAALQKAGYPVALFDPKDMDLMRYPWQAFDVAFLALHGGCGEDGTIQRIFENMGICYTGSTPEACRIAMSKLASKKRFQERNLPTPEAVALRRNTGRGCIERAAQRVAYPLVVKPDQQGSSLGVSIVREAKRLIDAVELAWTYDCVALLERFIAGRELTVAVLGREALPPVEISYQEEFFSYQAKYHDSFTSYTVPAPLPDQVLRRVLDAATEAVEAIGTHGLVRVDLRLDSEGTPWILEVNTTPGMTTHSLAPMAAAAIGWSMSDLCAWIVEEALQRRGKQLRQNAA